MRSFFSTLSTVINTNPIPVGQENWNLQPTVFDTFCTMGLCICLVEFCISEKEGMSKIVCDQLVNLMSCCSTKVFMKRLILLQELADSWMNNKDIRFITKGTGKIFVWLLRGRVYTVPASQLEQLPKFIVKCNLQ